MAEIPVSPFVLQDCVLTIEEDDFAAAASSIEIAPSSSSTNFKGLKKGSSFTFPGSATWAANLGFAQDWDNPDSLSNYLFDHEGETKQAHFEPVSGGQGFDVKIIITPGTIGGAVDAVGTSTVALGVQGKPTKTAPVVAPGAGA